jgi:hypothetical protein
MRFRTRAEWMPDRGRIYAQQRIGIHGVESQTRQKVRQVLRHRCLGRCHWHHLTRTENRNVDGTAASPIDAAGRFPSIEQPVAQTRAQPHRYAFLGRGLVTRDRPVDCAMTLASPHVQITRASIPVYVCSINRLRYLGYDRKGE